METTNFELDLLTPAERARAERDRKMCAEYSSMKEMARPWRIFGRLADKYNISTMQVFNIITSNGLYSPKG